MKYVPYLITVILYIGMANIMYRAGQPTKALRDIRSTVHKKAGSVSTSPQQTRMVFGKSQRKKPGRWSFHSEKAPG